MVRYIQTKFGMVHRVVTLSVIVYCCTQTLTKLQISSCTQLIWHCTSQSSKMSKKI